MRKKRRARGLRLLTLLLVVASALVAACGWDPSRPFEREAPKVNEAIAVLASDAGDAQAATVLLADYLGTGPCAEGNIGTPDRLHERPNATFDLGLALFRVAEAYGHRFGDEEGGKGALPGIPPPETPEKGAAAGTIECAMKIVRAVAEDQRAPVDLRARAFYLKGNLLFLDAKYKEAVEAYDKALELAPGMSDAGPAAAVDAGRTWSVDPVGRDAAWNRAVALRREEDKKDAAPPDGGSDKNDASDENKDGGKNDESKDGGGNQDGGKNDDKDKKDGGKNDDKKNDDKKDDDKKDGGSPPPKPPEQDAGPPPPSRASQDDRILDQLEAAPTVQQEIARQRQKGVRVRASEDK